MFNLPNLLSALIFFPILAGCLLLLLREESESGWEKLTALGVAVLNALLSLVLLSGAKATTAGVQVAAFQERFDWLKEWGVSYFLRVDGLSVFLILLVTWLTPVAMLASWRLIRQREALYHSLILLFSGGMVGVLCSMDLFLFYVFWEVMLLPAFFLVGMFGGALRREATVKFVIYTMVGSLFMLVGVVVVGHQYYIAHGHWSFSLLDLYGLALDAQLARWVFLSFVGAFAIKTALFPLHTWLPLTYDEAPAPVTFLLSALMAKLGIYGLLRVALPLFPAAAQDLSPMLVGLSVCGVVYAAFIALAQTNAKRLLAYASISHLGVILMGVFSLNAQAITGASFHMVAHALTTGALFLVVGMLWERQGSCEIEHFGGVANQAPFFATVTMVAVLASVGLPGLCGFVGEFLVFFGAFAKSPVAATIAVSSVVLGACYTLWMQQRVMFGPVPEGRVYADLNWREACVMVPMVLVVIGLGVYPQPVIARINPATGDYLAYMGVNAWKDKPSTPVLVLPGRIQKPVSEHGQH